MSSLRTELFAECGNLYMFCEIISDRQQIPHQVRDDGYLFFWLVITNLYVLKKMLILAMTRWALHIDIDLADKADLRNTPSSRG
jgi:hypothetical protein